MSILKRISFQFPSNGKAHSDLQKHGEDDHNLEMFQFPSNGKAHSDSSQRNRTSFAESFNSLQTGRHIQTIGTHVNLLIPGEGFNSLQTGRHIQTRTQYKTTYKAFYVSIPFKRGRHIQTRLICTIRMLNCVSIPFKREGTFRRSNFFRNHEHNMFQFPSNGKAHSDTLQTRTTRTSSSFNSLQTGRHIQTWRSMHGVDEGSCFNSLQTGRHIQTIGERGGYDES